VGERRRGDRGVRVEKEICDGLREELNARGKERKGEEDIRGE
jgi:hypothetical protein